MMLMEAMPRVGANVIKEIIEVLASCVRANECLAAVAVEGRSDGSLPDRHHRTGRPVVAVLCKGRLVDDDPLVAAATADQFVVEGPKIQTAACPLQDERCFTGFVDQARKLFCKIIVNLLREHVLWQDPRARHS